MKRLFALLLGVAALAAPAPKLEPRVHFVHEWEGGDPLRLYYEIPQPLVPNDPFGAKPSPNNDIVSVTGLPLKSWRIMDAFGKRNLELEISLKTGLDITFSSLKINGSSVAVAPSRVLYVKPLQKYPLSYERLQQQPNERLFLAMQIFNDSPETIFIDRIIFAPKGVSSDQVLVNPRYDSTFFGKLEQWMSSSSKTLPEGSSLANSNALKLKILPSRGFGLAIIGASIKFSCNNRPRLRDTAKRYDTFISQPLLQYRLGAGKAMLYPIPDQIIADICP